MRAGSRWTTGLLVLLVCAGDALMSRSDALRELRLKGSFGSKQLKTAYRQRSLETHPDKGGSADAFLRVSEAYETLAGSDGGSRPSPRRQSTRDMNPEDQQEAMRRAEEMLDKVMDELGDILSDPAKMDEWVDHFLGPSGKNPLKWLLKRTVKAGAHAVVGLLESDSATITVNGKVMSGGEFKAWRELRQKAAAIRRDKVDL